MSSFSVWILWHCSSKLKGNMTLVWHIYAKKIQLKIIPYEVLRNYSPWAQCQHQLPTTLHCFPQQSEVRDMSNLKILKSERSSWTISPRASVRIGAVWFGCKPSLSLSYNYQSPNAHGVELTGAHWQAGARSFDASVYATERLVWIEMLGTLKIKTIKIKRTWCKSERN